MREATGRSFRRSAVGDQRLPGKIERSGNEDARRRLEVELAGEIDGAFQIVARECRNTDASRNFGELAGGHGLVLVNRNGDDPAGESGKIPQEPRTVFGR